MPLLQLRSRGLRIHYRILRVTDTIEHAKRNAAQGPDNEWRDAWMGIKKKYVPQLKIVVLQPNPLSSGALAHSAPS